MRPYPPLGILYISGYLEDQGIQNEVYDTTFSSKKAFRTYLLTYKPKLIGIYVNLMTKLNVLETIRFVKENLTETTIILGGPEVRYSAENFLRYGADYIVIGEGEETMTELVNALSSFLRIWMMIPQARPIPHRENQFLESRFWTMIILFKIRNDKRSRI